MCSITSCNFQIGGFDIFHQMTHTTKTENHCTGLYWYTRACWCAIPWMKSCVFMRAAVSHIDLLCTSVHQRVLMCTSHWRNSGPQITTHISWLLWHNWMRIAVYLYALTYTHAYWCALMCVLMCVPMRTDVPSCVLMCPGLYWSVFLNGCNVQICTDVCWCVLMRLKTGVCLRVHICTELYLRHALMTVPRFNECTKLYSCVHVCADEC